MIETTCSSSRNARYNILLLLKHAMRAVDHDNYFFNKII
jgi:hypothetical protein